MHWGLPVLAYLVGSVSAAILVCRAMGLPDPRTEGSGNPGATNVLRVGGKKAAAITLLGDAAKGLLPVLLAHTLGAAPFVVGATALAAVLGHLFPVFFQFKGGKGVATAFGATLGVSLIAGMLALATWLAVALVFRYSSLAALVALALAPLYLWIVSNSVAIVLCAVAIAVLVYWRHSANIQRLLAGTEPKINSKS